MDYALGGYKIHLIVIDCVVRRLPQKYAARKDPISRPIYARELNAIFRPASFYCYLLESATFGGMAYISLKCLRAHMRTLWPNVNFAIF